MNCIELNCMYIQIHTIWILFNFRELSGHFWANDPTLRLFQVLLSAIYIWLEDQWRWSVIWHFQTHYNILYVKSVTRLMVWQQSTVFDFCNSSLIRKMKVFIFQVLCLRGPSKCQTYLILLQLFLIILIFFFWFFNT